MRAVAVVCFLLAQKYAFVDSSLHSRSRDAPKLQQYNVTADSLTVSGISSGGYMAVQFHVAFSKTVHGAGVTAGGPFYCAQDNLLVAMNACMKEPSLIDVSELVEITQQTAKDGFIDPTSCLENDRVFLISGTKDTTVEQGVMESLRSYYSAFVKSSNIKENFTIPAAHAQLTNDFGNPCNVSASPYISNCDFPSAFVLLDFIYGGDISYADSSKAVESNLFEFDQSGFFYGTPAAFSMDSTGYVYVPTACQNGAISCRLHVAFHGCLMGEWAIGNAFTTHGGYNAVAEANSIIVLFPQTVKMDVLNPKGCWDWWGFTGPDYASQLGSQMIGVKLMVDRIMGN